MAEVKIKSEVAGRVCALPVSIGAAVKPGDDVAIVEAMKMEIPIQSSAAGKVRSIAIAVDDVVAEGQVLVVIET